MTATELNRLCAFIEDWKINTGALLYFGILTFLDRPDIMVYGDSVYSDGKLMNPAGGSSNA